MNKHGPFVGDMEYENSLLHRILRMSISHFFMVE